MKKGFISICVILLLFLGSLFLGKLPFSICLSIFAVLSLRELLNIQGKEKHIPSEIELLSYLIVIFFTMNNFDMNLDYYVLDYKLLASLILIDFIPLVLINDKRKYNILDALYLIGSTLFIGITFNLIAQFRSYDVNYVIYIMLIALFTDSFGFITGKYIGRRRLVPSISPKKTVEGALGGLFMGTFVSSLFYLSTIPSRLPILGVIIITMILSIIGQLGDLVFSFIKREFGKKDFSNIVAGNGGILDVLDSIIFVTLGFLLFLSIL